MRAPNANAKEDLWRQIQFSATDGGDATLTGGGGVALLAFLESGESLRMNVRGEERGVGLCSRVASVPITVALTCDEGK